MPLLPRHGLYDPDFEHDACGVGFVAHIRGEKSRSLVEQGLELGLQVPSRRCYPVGQVFLPRNPHARRRCETLAEEATAKEATAKEATAKEGQRVLVWWDVPIAPEHLGQTARAGLPVLRQIYISRRRVVPSAFKRNEALPQGGRLWLRAGGQSMWPVLLTGD